MKITCVFFIACFLVAACKNSLNKKNDQSFKKILQELLLAKALVGELKSKDSSLNDSLLYAQYAKGVFIKYKTNKDDFEKKLNEVKNNPQSFEILVDSINNTLTQNRYKQISTTPFGNL